MASEIVPGRLFLGPEVAMPELARRLLDGGVGVLILRCMECAPDTLDYRAVVGLDDATPKTAAVTIDVDGPRPPASAAAAPSSAGVPAPTARMHHLVLRDEPSQDIAQQAIPDAVDLVGDWLALDAATDQPHQRRAVLVHCAAGVSRSASITVALVMNFGERLCGPDLLDAALAGPLPRRAHGRVGLERALSFVASRRRVVSPNEGFLAQLMAYEAAIGAGGGDDGLQPTFDPKAHKVRTLAGVCGASHATALRALEEANMDINRAAEFIFTGVVGGGGADQ